jgi:hypothetical protein
MAALSADQVRCKCSGIPRMKDVREPIIDAPEFVIPNNARLSGLSCAPCADDNMSSEKNIRINTHRPPHLSTRSHRQ